MNSTSAAGVFNHAWNYGLIMRFFGITTDLLEDSLKVRSIMKTDKNFIQVRE